MPYSHVRARRRGRRKGRSDEVEAEAAQAGAAALAHAKPDHLSSSGQVLHLQRTAGNQAVQRLLRSGHATVQRLPSLSGLKRRSV
jgi:hypothetical protein